MGPLKINLSQAFAGRKVGVKQVEEKIWLVSFMRYRSPPLRRGEPDKPSSNVSAKSSTGHRTRSSISAWPPRNARVSRSQSDTRPIC
jgi:hypothetical protein